MNPYQPSSQHEHSEMTILQKAAICVVVGGTLCGFIVPSEESAPDLLIQIFWQKIDESDKTEFVAQSGEFETAEDMHRWIRETVESRKSECPEGWHPMICDARSKYFLPNAGR